MSCLANTSPSNLIALSLNLLLNCFTNDEHEMTPAINESNLQDTISPHLRMREKMKNPFRNIENKTHEEKTFRFSIPCCFPACVMFLPLLVRFPTLINHDYLYPWEIVSSLSQHLPKPLLGRSLL